ncbi:MAG TPA: alkaline phosphatase, partial [Candidatus Limnocylindria bacterium]|nr:alkaline phosphatase [Candidatus Limnocylindria bacterium]
MTLSNNCLHDHPLARWSAFAAIAGTLGISPLAEAAPVVTRLTPPSALFSFNDPTPPYIARFLEGQRFDLQATIVPDEGQAITQVGFYVDGKLVNGPVSVMPATAFGVPTNAVIYTLRAYSNKKDGVHTLEVRLRQSDNARVTAKGNFEVVEMKRGDGKRAKNVIVLIGDGLGIAHRTAARLMLRGAAMGKANGHLSMDKFSNVALINTHSLNSIVTDSSPGSACYSTGNKANNNQHGVFPDDTSANFDNPRVESIAEFLWRTEGKTLGIVTTSDVFDATPAAWGSHTQSRAAGTGIIDQYLDEMVPQGLRVLLGGGRKWFLPNTEPGTARAANSDYVLPAELASAWDVPTGAIDPERDALGDFIDAGFTYAADRAQLKAVSSKTKKLLGLFSFSNMNVAKDKIDKRRDPGAVGVVDDYGFPDQPML